MSEHATEKNILHSIYGWILSILLAVAGVSLAVACVQIYRLGASPFTRESIAAAFHTIRIPVFLCLGGIFGGLLLTLFAPQAPVKLRGKVESKATLARLRTRVDPLACDPIWQEKLKKEPKIRIALRIGFALLAVAAAIPVLVYLCDGSHFTMELNESVLGLALMTIPFVLITGVAALAEIALENASISREIALVKELITQGGANGVGNKPSQKKLSNGALWGIRVAILLLAALLLILGSQNGGMADVLGKAVKICTECIGLG